MVDKKAANHEHRIYQKTLQPLETNKYFYPVLENNSAKKEFPQKRIRQEKNVEAFAELYASPLPRRQHTNFLLYFA